MKKRSHFKKKGLSQLEILVQWCQKSKALQVYFVLGLVGHSSAFNLGIYCHDNTVVKVLQEMYWNVQKCITMYCLIVSMATAKQPQVVKCVAYENSSPRCILKFKTLQKFPLCICNDMLIYIVQV